MASGPGGGAREGGTDEGGAGGGAGEGGADGAVVAHLDARRGAVRLLRGRGSGGEGAGNRGGTATLRRRR
eukprot:2508126-Pleurochrysis_carterae.AAC.3